MKKSFLLSLFLTLSVCSYHQTSPLLIVGTRSRKTEEGVFSSKCLICSKESDVNIKAYSMRSWFSLFFIPVFPYSKKKYYLKCTQCKNYYKPPEEMDIEKILQNEDDTSPEN